MDTVRVVSEQSFEQGRIWVSAASLCTVAVCLRLSRLLHVRFVCASLEVKNWWCEQNINRAVCLFCFNSDHWNIFCLHVHHETGRSLPTLQISQEILLLSWTLTMPWQTHRLLMVSYGARPICRRKWTFYIVYAAVTTKIRLRFDGRSTAYERSLTSTWRNPLAAVTLTYLLCLRPYRAEALSDAFVWRLSIWHLSVWRLSLAYIGPNSRTERPRKTKIGTEVAHVTRDSDTTFKVKRWKVNLLLMSYIANMPEWVPSGE